MTMCAEHQRAYWNKQALERKQKHAKPQMVIDYRTQILTMTIPFAELKSSKSPEDLEKFINVYRTRGYDIIKKGE